MGSNLRYGAYARPRKRGRSGSCFANARTHEFFALGEASTGHGAMLCKAIFSSASTSQNLTQSALSLASLEMDAPLDRHESSALPILFICRSNSNSNSCATALISGNGRMRNVRSFREISCSPKGHFVSGKRLNPKGASARRHGPRRSLKAQWRRAEADRREAISRAAGVRGRASAPIERQSSARQRHQPHLKW